MKNIIILFKQKIKNKFKQFKSEYILFKHAKEYKFNIGKNINYTGLINDLVVGEATTINGNANLRFKNGKIKIGKNCLIARNVTILTQTYDIDTQKEISSKNMVVKNVVIGDNVWVGSNVVIMPGINIGDNAVVGAGAIVTKNIHDFEIWAGNPAKKIRTRKCIGK